MKIKFLQGPSFYPPNNSLFELGKIDLWSIIDKMIVNEGWIWQEHNCDFYPCDPCCSGGAWERFPNMVITRDTELDIMYPEYIVFEIARPMLGTDTTKCSICAFAGCSVEAEFAIDELHCKAGVILRESEDMFEYFRVNEAIL